MNSAFLQWWGCGAFHVELPDVNLAFDPYLFDENLATIEPKYEYLFLTHEHFDHCHPETLKQLCRGDQFETLVVSPGCMDPNRPIDENYGNAAFERDLPISKHIPAENIQVVYPKYRDDRQRGRAWEGDHTDREFPGPTELNLGPLTVEVIESGENQTPLLPTCGYLVTHEPTGITFLDIGDLWEPYPALEDIDTDIDFLIHMKLGLDPLQDGRSSQPLETLIDQTQPTYLIPTHYRTDRQSDPIPEGHWPPNVSDVAAFLESIRAAVGDATRVLPFTAGLQYEYAIEADAIKWNWKWVESWDEPKWVGNPE